MSTLAINPMQHTVLFVAQEKIPPAYEAIIWNGTIECLQAVGARYHLSGYIDKDGSLILQKRPETNYKDRVQIGEYIVFIWTGGFPKFVNILPGAEFIKRFVAHPNGKLTISGQVSL